jgi:hypothetical protein
MRVMAWRGNLAPNNDHRSFVFFKMNQAEELPTILKRRRRNPDQAK